MSSATPADPGPRFARLIQNIRAADARAIWVDQIVGLRLNVDLLRVLGARPDLLDQWENGFHLEVGKDLAPQECRNHPSLTQHPELADAEWDRLEKKSADPACEFLRAWA